MRYGISFSNYKYLSRLQQIFLDFSMIYAFSITNQSGQLSKSLATYAQLLVMLSLLVIGSDMIIIEEKYSMHFKSRFLTFCFSLVYLELGRSRQFTPVFDFGVKGSSVQERTIIHSCQKCICFYARVNFNFRKLKKKQKTAETKTKIIVN